MLIALVPEPINMDYLSACIGKRVETVKLMSCCRNTYFTAILLQILKKFKFNKLIFKERMFSKDDV